MYRFQKIQYRLLAFVSLLLLVTSFLTLVAIDWLIVKSQNEEISLSLQETERAVRSFLRVEQEKLSQSAKLVGELPIIAVVVENGDEATIRDSAQSYQKHLGIPTVDIMDSDGESLVSLENYETPEDHAVTEYLNTEVLENETLPIILGQRLNRISLMAAAPIGIPDDPSGVLILGQYLDDTLANYLKELTKAEVSFISNEEITGSSLSLEQRDALHETLQSKWSFLKDGILAPFDLNNYRIHVSEIKGQQGQPLGHLVIQVSLEHMQAVLSKIHYSMFGIGVLIFLASSLASYILSLRITAPIKATTHALNQRAHELGEISTSIAQSSYDLFQGSANQSDHLSDATQSMQRVTNQSLQNSTDATKAAEVTTQTAEKAEHATQQAKSAIALSKAAQNNVEEGSHVVRKIIHSMQDIQNSNQEIVTMLTRITEIAKHTSILATNASIEAAHAGVQGKGFAVVANEVDQLAKDSQEAANRISQFVVQSEERTESGVKLADQGEQTLEIISESTSNVSQIIENLYKIAEEQLEHTQRVRENVDSIRNASQEQTKEVDTTAQYLKEIRSIAEVNAVGARDGVNTATQLKVAADNLKTTITDLRLLV